MTDDELNQEWKKFFDSARCILEHSEHPTYISLVGIVDMMIDHLVAATPAQKRELQQLVGLCLMDTTSTIYSDTSQETPYAV